MQRASKILTTAILACGALAALYAGFEAIFALENICVPSLAKGFCRAVVTCLSAILFFVVVYLFMLTANRVWGRQLFGGSWSR